MAHSHPGEAPIAVLVREPKSGVQLDAPGEIIEHPATDLAAWGAAQHVSLSPELREVLQTYEPEGGGAKWMKAPRVDFYSMTRTWGNSGCSDSRSFVVRDGIAVLVPTPGESADDDGGGCSNGAEFGKINDSSVAVIEDYSWRPGMTASVDVWTWSGREFAPACGISLSYRPRFSGKTFNTWGDRCSGKDCDSLREAAFKLATSAEEDADGLQRTSPGDLNDAQRAQFEIMQKGFEAKSRDPSSNDAFSIPFVRGKRLYLASVGHFAIGWRDFADWSVVFATLEGGELKPAGDFAVGTWKGDLTDVQVTAK